MSLKLLYITNGINGPGGLERVLSIKASMLADTFKYDVNILTLNQDSNALFYDFSSKIKFHNINAIGNPLQYIKQYRAGIKHQIAAIKPDIILVCDDGLKGLMLPLVIGKPCPMVYERHVSKNIEIKTDKRSLFFKIMNRFKFKCMDFGASFYDAFVVLTQGNLNEWHLKNIQVISNPLSFYPSEVSTLTNKKVIAVGKQCYQKGYDRLLQSWKLVSEKHPDWQLAIYGTIDESQKLNNLAKELNIETTVTFYPPVKNINDKYQQASIYAMSSRYEGFGMVLTEAMAYGVPCVSFNCPYGPSDIIANEVDGFLVSNGDISKFSEKIIALIENETLRHRMGTLAKEHVKRFLPDVIVPQWDALFNTLIPLK